MLWVLNLVKWQGKDHLACITLELDYQDYSDPICSDPYYSSEWLLNLGALVNINILLKECTWLQML